MKAKNEGMNSMRAELAAIIAEAAGINAEIYEEKREEFGHYTTPAALRLGKEKGENPRILALDLIRKIESAAPDLFERLEAAGPGFINMWLSPEAVRQEFRRVYAASEYGSNSSGEGETVIVEFSSPNMAKEMHAGHLRNNSLGEALARIHAENGYKVIRWNYVGDWGTQFGMIIAAYKSWGEEIDLNHQPIRKLEELYVRYMKEAKEDPEMEARGKEEFRKLEAGDDENREIWNRFRTASLQEIEKLYRRFGIRFDEYIGESFFEETLKGIVKGLLEDGTAKFSEGAVIVPLDQFGLPPALIQKSDGASLYLTRDIAALKYRVENYNPKKMLYVVGNEQTLSFEQLFAIAGLMGVDSGVDLEHVKYGLLLGSGGKKMSTREGTSIHAADMADEAVERAGKIVAEKNPDLSPEECAKIAEGVGLGALKYFMLRENRLSDIVFDWDKMLEFRGDSGPYLLYTFARLHKLLEKSGGAELSRSELAELKTEHELRLMRKLFAFPDEIRKSAEELSTNNLTNYLYELANLTNRFYEDEPILTDTHSGRRHARLILAEAAARVLKKGLWLLGIDALESI